MFDIAPVTGYEGSYMVHTDGSIYSMKFGKTRNKACKLQCCIHKKGYVHVVLRKNGERKTMMVADIVARAFLGKKSKGYRVYHKDHNKSNVALSNLQYMSTKEIYRRIHPKTEEGLVLKFEKIALQEIRKVKELRLTDLDKYNKRVFEIANIIREYRKDLSKAFSEEKEDKSKMNLFNKYVEML